MTLCLFGVISINVALTCIWLTPGRPPIRPSMDWTQEPQVMPSTPRVTRHRLALNAIPPLEDESKQDGMYKHACKTDTQVSITGHTSSFLTHESRHQSFSSTTLDIVKQIWPNKRAVLQHIWNKSKLWKTTAWMVF